MFMLKPWVICLVLLCLVGCGRTIQPISEGFHNHIPEKGTRLVVWGNHESAVGAAVTWLQRKKMRLVERARILEVFKEQKIQLTHSSEDEGDILRVGRLLGADCVVFVDTTMRSNERLARNQYGAAAWIEYHLSVTVRGVNVETSEILWSGSAQYPKGINNPESGMVFLTQNALGHAWCPEGKWTDGGCKQKAGQTN
jgi:hypothetical protein